ncbi:uncharacterized protein [Arachis hypogaea]|uniref:uncharacterized protein n=1 Tax=Arachis hypogaea TaxID=3818 RepID=UPI003B21CF75
MARLLGDLVAYRATGTGHMELLAVYWMSPQMYLINIIAIVPFVILFISGISRTCSWLNVLVEIVGVLIRGYYGGQLLTAIGADANNHIFPIAYAIVESENKDSWKWFLELLQDDVGDHAANGFNLMSDMQKGLIPAVKDIMPGAHHRFCAMHIYQNFRKQWPDLEMKAAMWACSKATTPQDFEQAMGRVKRINQHAWEYLNKIPPQQWPRSHFSEYPKVDFYTNNNCETFNGKIKKMRGKPIITMLEEVRGYVMRILARNKKALVGYHGRITPVQQSRLEREKKESNYWRPFPSGDEDGNVYEVQRLPVKVMAAY